VALSYVKWLELAGAQAIPISWWMKSFDKSMVSCFREGLVIYRELQDGCGSEHSMPIKWATSFQYGKPVWGMNMW
jgi:hypothetical protein